MPVYQLTDASECCAVCEAQFCIIMCKLSQLNQKLELAVSLCTTCSSVSIESWILPMVYAGHVNTVAWLTPFWTEHSFAAESSFQVGKDMETQQIR